MGTVTETLGFEPEVLWMPELDELNSDNGRLALNQSARAYLLAAIGCNVTVSDSDAGYVLTIDRECELASSPIFRIAVSGLCATALHRLIKKPVIWSQSETVSQVAIADGKLIFGAELTPDLRARVMSIAADGANAVGSHARALLANGFLVINRFTSEPTPQPAAAEPNPLTDVLDRVVDVLEAVTKPRVTEVKRDEAGLISEVTTR